MRKFRVVVVGCGGMAHTWIQYAKSRPDTEIVALVDVYKEATEKMKKQYQLDVLVETDVARAIKETNANLVFDITVPTSHKDVTITALQLGCHVFGEKPMGASIQEAKEMVKAAEESGLSYFVMQNRRYHPHIRALRDFVQAGKIGDLSWLTANFFLAPRFGGFREEMASPLIIDMAIHTFDQARFILKANPVSVYCHEFNLKGSWYKGNASAICIFEMDNGTVFSYQGSWSAIGAPTSWESSWRLIGSKGTALWDGTAPPYAEIAKTKDDQFLPELENIQIPLDWNGQEGHDGCLDEMFQALKDGRKAETDCTDNLYSIAMVYAAVESAKTGEKINIDEWLAV